MSATCNAQLGYTPLCSPAREELAPFHPSASIHREPVPSFIVFTTVLWLAILGVGLVGFAVGYSRPQPPVAVIAQPLHTELVKVTISEPELPPPQPARPVSDLSNPPPVPQPLAALPEMPPLVPVAQPNAAIAFAVPVDKPARIVEPAKAIYTRQPEAPAPSVAAPPLQTLTFGQGEGRQPAPHYPLRAIQEGQEGTVTVRLAVAENGAVTAAEAVAPSPWPLLNHAALTAVRERWRFHTGPSRLFEVAIRFQLHK